MIHLSDMRGVFVFCFMCFSIAFLFILDTAHSQENKGYSASLAPLIPDSATMETAWDIPNNPLSDTTLGNSYLANQIRLGFEIFTNTPHKAPQYSGNALSCSNCHLNAGQKEKALPLVGIASVYPEYNKRAGRLITLEDRIVECFMRSSHASGVKRRSVSTKDHRESTLSTHTPEVLAIASYLTWLSSGYSIHQKLPWRGLNIIPTHNLLPIDELDTQCGKELFLEHCINCHGEDGQGIAIGDKKAGPLWGPRSWNDGAGAARIYTLAGIIKHMMPYLNPGILTDEDAQHIAAFINSQPRPHYPFKSKDYLTEQVPPDAVYYLQTKKLSNKKAGK